MIELEKIVFNSFKVNTYIVYDETGECLIIDPACYSDQEKDKLFKFISQKNLSPVLHLNTHCHIDHILGMHFVRLKYNVPSCANILESELLSNGPLMGNFFGFDVEPYPPLDRELVHDEIISFGNSTLRAIHVPGHSKGSMAFYSEEADFVITGDALFAGSIGRTDLPGGDYDTLIRSIRTNLFTLPGNTTVWPGHGSSTSIKEETIFNPFFNDYKT